MDRNEQLAALLMNLNIARQGEKARENMTPPGDVMHPRYNEWAKNQRMAEQLLLGLDIAGSLAPAVGMAKPYANAIVKLAMK